MDDSELAALIELSISSAGTRVEREWIKNVLLAAERSGYDTAKEEAARVCEAHAEAHECDAELEEDKRFAVYAKHERRCASAIRSLKP